MIQKELLNILQQNEDLKTILKPTSTDKKIYMFDTQSKGNVITYNYVSLVSNGVIEQARFEVNCISKDYSTAAKMRDIVKSALVTVGDNKLTNNILEVTQNGGGTLKDADSGTYKIKIIFTIKSIMKKA